MPSSVNGRFCPRPCRTGGEASRFNKARRIGDAATRDSVSCPVGHACPDERQPERNVYRAQASHQLQCDMSLVMIHGHDSIKLAGTSADKERITGKWTCGI